MIKYNAIVTNIFCCILKEVIKYIPIKGLIIFLYYIYDAWFAAPIYPQYVRYHCHAKTWTHTVESFLWLNIMAVTDLSLCPQSFFFFLFVFLLFLLCHPDHFRLCHQEPCNSYQRDRPWRRPTARLPSSTPACSTTSRLWPACSCSSQRSFPQVSLRRQMTAL